jgi:Na+-transporting methylmalonyl-CoA/oxaloacetate decarboxylase gamma subunit
MNDALSQFLSVLVAAAAIVAIVWLVTRMLRPAGGSPRKAAGTSAPAAAPPGGGIGPELVAVIAAAIAAESGLGINEFRVVGVNRAEGSGSFNTPVWGHVDRLAARSFGK